MKTLEECKDDVAKLACYGYLNWTDMVLTLDSNTKNKGLIEQRLLLATFNYALQFNSKDELIKYIDLNTSPCNP